MSDTAIPTHVITGFLGVGKTSAIQHLLRQKPANETWAVLVNEFGEIGVDGGLIEGDDATRSGVLVYEVPGGCMCCSAGLPMHMVLSEILFLAQPDRLLIEPTGLGHPREVLQTLAAEAYRDTLSLQRTVTLVDARQLSDARYIEHPTFQQQLDIADVIVGNKQDLYSAQDIARFDAFFAGYQARGVMLQMTEQGRLSLDRLAGETRCQIGPGHLHHGDPDRVLAADQPMPECGYLKASNAGEGFESVGWRFSADLVFDYERLRAWMNSLRVERLKAVFITDRGIYAFNQTREARAETALDDCLESRIEIIDPKTDQTWEESLLACVSR